MSKILIDDKEFNVSDLSENSRSVCHFFSIQRKRLQNSRIYSLCSKRLKRLRSGTKSEVLAQKAGIVVDE